MSRQYAAVPPPSVVNIASLTTENGGQDDSGFAKPLPPPRPKIESTLNKIKQPTRKRKSRFSDAPPSTEAPPPKVLQTISDLEQTDAKQSEDGGNKAAVAAAAAARINAVLLAQGKIKPSSITLTNQLTSQSTASTSIDHPNPVSSAEVKKVDSMYVCEVEINDVPIGCRNYLTRLSTQEGINKSYFAFVSTRGKYMTTEEKKQHPLLMGGEKPLYLFIQSESEVNLRKALDRIKQIIDNHYEKKSKYQSEALAQIAALSQKVTTTNVVPTSVLQGFTPGVPLIQASVVAPLPHFQPALPSGNFVQEKVFIGMDNAPENFDLKTKLLGQNYRNFNFISNQTGAKVILRGKGSGFIEPTSGREAFESMHAFISHPNQAGIDAAKKLVLNLVDTLKKQLPPHLRPTETPSQMGIPSSHNVTSYNAVPSAMPVPPPSTQTATVTAYPFQQTAPFSVSTAPKPQSQDDGDSVLGYQHNFPGSDYSSRFESLPKKSSKSKSRKRFTEEPEMPSPSANDENKRESEPSSLDKKSSSLPFWMTN